MRRLGRDRAMTLGFVAFSFALAFWQRPGWATSDTKIDLHIDPVRFLGQVASVWTPTTDLGEVHSAQYSGYLWPMGPFFAALHSIGITPWVVQRLWLGLLFALSVWGMLRLLDLLVGRPRGVLHLVAAAFYLVNPYVTVFTARTSITLLGYAALPWLLIVVHQGIRTSRGALRGWRGWWWAAAFALIFASTGGGVNAAVVGWMLVGPLVLMVYEPAIGSVRWRDSGGFLARVVALGLLASLWWIVPLLVHVRYGIDFLQFTEQPRTIWATNSVTESLRLMGYWTSYLGVGFFTAARSYFSDGGTLLFNPLVVGAGLLLPALAIAGFVTARRLRYALFELWLVLVGLLVMVGGFPDGTPLRSGMEWVYRNVFVLRFMRTTDKAAPLVALGLAGLLGFGARFAWARLRGLPAGRLRRVALVAAPLALAGLMALAALPLVRGGALDTQVEWKAIPAAWTGAGRDLNRDLAPNTRALVLPGQIFAFYNWGGTLDAILPRLTDRPVAVRYETPYSDLHAVDLMTTVDDLAQQRRLLPGQLPGLLRLMGVGALVTGADDADQRSGALAPAAAGELAMQGLGPARSYGPVRAFAPASGDIGASVPLPEVRRYNVVGARGIVHVDPTGPATLVDGGAAGLADLSAFDGLPSRAPVFFAGDLSVAALRREATAGANIVVTDSNRRRAFLPQFPQQDLGPTLPTNQAFDVNSALINPFPKRGTNAQTVTVLKGDAVSVTAPIASGFPQFPEQGPLAAFDGSLSTAWLAERYLPRPDRYIQIIFKRPRDVPYVEVYPLDDSHGSVTAVVVNGVRAPIGRGWTRVAVRLRHVRVLRVGIAGLRQPPVGLGTPGGFRELRIPGFQVSPMLRAPVVVARGLSGQDLRRDSLTFLFERTTGDNPFQRDRYVASPVPGQLVNRGDPERFIDRLVFAPAARSYATDAWVFPAVSASDSALDGLAGYTGPDTFDSSSRFQDQPRYRASSAFDGRPGTAWIGDYVPPDNPDPWISWSTPRVLTVSSLRLTPPVLPVRRPTVVRLSWPGGSSPALRVEAGGRVVLPRPVRARAFRLTVLDARFPPGVTGNAVHARAVGIGSLSVPGLAPVAVPVAGALHAPCGTVRVQAGGRVVALAPLGTIAQLDAGQPLRARSCGAAVPVGAGVQEIRALPGVFSVDLLRMTSPAPLAPPPAAPPSAGRVVDPGTIGNSSVGGVRVSLARPSWLVLGESFDTGWQASCNGRSLGPPQVIDGYANGWLAPAGCTAVAFTFGPQHGVNVAYVVSAATCLLLLLFLAFGWRRRRALVRDPMAWVPIPDPGPQPMPLLRAAAIALVAAVPLALFFALRAGVGLFPLLTFVLWRGFRPRSLAIAAVGLLGVVVPLIYLVTQPRNQGGFDFSYSTDLIWAHWVGVAAVVLLGVCGWKLMAGVRRGRDRRPAGDLPLDPLDVDESPLGGKSGGPGSEPERELAGSGAGRES